MFRNPEVASPNKPEVPEEGMPGAGGVPSSGSTPAVGMPTQGAVDATELEKQLEVARKSSDEIKQRYERDMRQMQSSLQSGFSKQQQEWEKERKDWKQRLDEIATKDLDDTERTKYELQRAREQVQEVQAQAAELEARYQNESLKIQYANQFMEMGVNPKGLVLNQGLEELVASGWAQVMEELQTLRSKGQPATAQTSQTAPVAGRAPQAPNVVTGVGGSPVTGVSIEKMIEETGKRIGRPNLTEEEFWRLVENQQIPFDGDSVLRTMTGQ